VPAQDTGAEIKALGLMVVIALVMGILVIVFKPDYRLASNWESNRNYYPNVKLPKGDPLAASSLKDDTSEAADEAGTETEIRVDAEELRAASRQQKQTISPDRPDIEAISETDPRLDPDYDGDDRLPSKSVDQSLTREALP
jgi:hypothetical protein